MKLDYCDYCSASGINPVNFAQDCPKCGGNGVDWNNAENRVLQGIKADMFVIGFIAGAVVGFIIGATWTVFTG